MRRRTARSKKRRSKKRGSQRASRPEQPEVRSERGGQTGQTRSGWSLSSRPLSPLSSFVTPKMAAFLGGLAAAGARFAPAAATRMLRLLRHPVLRRLAQAIFVAFLLMVFAFLLIRLIPGDPAMILLGDVATEEDLIAYRKLLGIDGSLMGQFGRYVSNLARGDFGISIRSREPILSIVQKRLPVSLWLTATSIFMTVVLALPLGVAAALYRRTWFGHAFQIGASVLVATPVFFSGLLLILLFAVQINLAPIAGYHAGFPANLYYLWLPALTINLVLVPVLARILQSSIVETDAEEFVEAAIIRGTQGWRFYWRYLLRPSLAPTVAALGYFAATVVSYAVIIEIIFNLPGIGMTLVDAVRNRDYPLVQGIVFLSGLLVVGLTFMADLVNGWLDPRAKMR